MKIMIVVLVSTLLSLLGASSAEARRVALVIGNSDYVFAGKLANPAADAQLIAASLSASGFDNVEQKFDLNKSTLEKELKKFSKMADGAEVALIYFAGHGIEVNGENYLIPTDAQLAKDRDLEIEATRLNAAILMTNGAGLKIIILDACRNNPLATRMVRTSSTRSIGRGLAAVEPEGETLVVYAAKAGTVALDGNGANSPFATSLARRIREPGIELSILFRKVREDVVKETSGEQTPYTYGSLSSKLLYFISPAPEVLTQTTFLNRTPQEVASIPIRLDLILAGNVVLDSRASSAEGFVFTDSASSRDATVNKILAPMRVMGAFPDSALEELDDDEVKQIDELKRLFERNYAIGEIKKSFRECSLRMDDLSHAGVFYIESLRRAATGDKAALRSEQCRAVISQVREAMIISGDVKLSSLDKQYVSDARMAYGYFFRVTPSMVLKMLELTGEYDPETDDENDVSEAMSMLKTQASNTFQSIFGLDPMRLRVGSDGYQIISVE